MKKLSLILLSLLAFNAFSQDTVWVQTYTFDTISTRRATFDFPQELDTMRFEKVLMYFKLKCSPLTTWDNYDCGEWDYLTYTRIFDHTGNYDSTRHDGYTYKVNTQTPGSFSWKNAPYFDQRWVPSTTVSPVSVAQFTPGSTAAGNIVLMKQGTNGRKMQWLVSASELSASGAVAGNMQGLALDFIQSFAKLEGVTIKIAATAASSLTSWQTPSFTTVFDGQLRNIATGNNPIYFSAPFAWDGTSNLVIELNVADVNAAAADLFVAGENGLTNGAISYTGLNGIFTNTATDYADVNMSQVDLGGNFTIAFWANGNGNFGNSSTMLEGVDSVNNRILNIHFPWSDNNIYFDAGNQNGYDRIQKVVVQNDVDNGWHHWAFVKDAAAGNMYIYRDGVLFHSGSGLTRSVGKITRLNLASSADGSYHFKGNIDEFSIWSEALDLSEITTLKQNKVTPSNPNYASLMLYYDFDDVLTAVDKSPNLRHAMPSSVYPFPVSDLPVTGVEITSERPAAQYLFGSVSVAADSVLETQERVPLVMFEYGAGNNSFNVLQNSVVYAQNTIDTLRMDGTVISHTNTVADGSFSLNPPLTYYDDPFEVIHDVEIGRYITPYGIGFSLGANGFTWMYDVTDYQKYLHGSVDLAAHNTQELLDLKFAFVRGTPPRDVQNVEPVWNNWQSYNYAQMASNTVLSATDVQLSDSSQMFKIKTRLTGHGEAGNTACCEWKPNDHKIYINGQERFTWSIWQTNDCGENPNIKQGGTWPYAREGWCPGDMVKEHDFELTPYVSPGQTVNIDYDITPVTASDPAEGSGNYIAAFDLVSYSAPNFQHDAAIVDILNPNSYDYYSKFNPNCSNPRIILQNTGSEPLTKCTIRLWAVYGNWQEFEWTGSLNFLEKTIVEIPLTNSTFWGGIDMSNPVFYAQVYAVGGYPDLDEYAQNNVFKTNFSAVESLASNFAVQFTTNNKANENKWRLINASGDTIFERTNLDNSTIYKDTFNLSPGCYSIILEDSDHDGIGFWYSAQVEGETNGSFYVRKISGGNYEVFPTDFGAYHRYDFSVGFTLGLNAEEMKDKELQVYPNPAVHTVHAEYNGYNGKVDSVELYDANGRKLMSVAPQQDGTYVSTDIDVSVLNPGYYFIHFTGQDGTLIGKIIKQ